MSMLSHIQLLTTYNSRFNTQVFDAAENLTQHQLDKDLGAFFKSVNGTLNHIVAADILWLGRFYEAFRPFASLSEVSQFIQPRSLDDLIYPDFMQLKQARKKMDGIICEWASSDLTEKDLGQNLTYANTKGVTSTRNFGEVVMHVFNHHTHHRGQASTLLYQLGQDVGATDFLLDIPVS